MMELYAILLPYSCFINAVEARDCSLALIVPLVRGLLSAIRDVALILRTTIAQAIFRDMHIRFLSRISVNNLEEAAAAYSLTLEGRGELRERERGYSTEGTQAAPEIQQLGGRDDLKRYIKSELGYDQVMEAVTQMIAQSEPMTDGGEPHPSAFEMEPLGLSLDEPDPEEAGPDRIAASTATRWHSLRTRTTTNDLYMIHTPISTLWRARASLDSPRTPIMIRTWFANDSPNGCLLTRRRYYFSKTRLQSIIIIPWGAWHTDMSNGCCSPSWPYGSCFVRLQKVMQNEFFRCRRAWQASMERDSQSLA
jgi:hypothetical protein